MRGGSPMHPDDCIQSYITPWWNEQRNDAVVRGRLLWTWVPYPDEALSPDPGEQRG